MTKRGCLTSTPLILRLENTDESQGCASDSVKDSEGLNLRKGVPTAGWSRVTYVDKEPNMWLCRH